MKNIPSGPRLLGNGNYSYDIKLSKATISVTRDKGNRNPYWKLVYDVDGMTSKLSIIKFTDEKSGDYINVDVGELFSLHPHQWSELTVQVKKDKKTCLLYPILEMYNNLTNAEYGESLSDGVKTQRWVYACGTRKGLVVIVNKKKSKEEQPYMVTVAHYYVNSDSGGSGVDIGFSGVVKIGVVNGKLDYSVDGPVEHPSSALLYMMEEVCRIGKWKPSTCPHCKNIQSQQRRLVSDSEDSDTNLPTAPPSHGGQQNASNIGRFNGDGIGSMIRAKNVNFIKRWT
ncbi:uncharacterized protein LOC106766652 [Vigna radiata var. radiata]|uniref:Uncharacterized protein LOC106766652 n=1 Tax=Vigna radiata var. radiata TaxID=3916 RepID=A0A1S3ULI9_VIGRR|nr:uncharacterized protein LOC106766652 [Vigna radiata var. radiata]